VSPSGGFDPTSISALLAVVVLFMVYCCKGFFVGVCKGLMDLSRVVPLLVPLGCIFPGTPFQTTFYGGNFSWCSCQEFIGPHHSFDAFHFYLCLPALIWFFFWGLLLGCSALFHCSCL
jgi:hypothetical protein